MALDFQQIRQQIKKLGEQAPQREEELRDLWATAQKLLTKNSLNLDYLRDKVQRAAALNSYFRSAVPTDEALTDSFPLPPMPEKATVIAADGSQIFPDRHLGVEYSLVNVGAICMDLSVNTAPDTRIESQLYYGEEMFSMQEKIVALIRDMREREFLAELAEEIEGPVITFTDGPIELWGREVSLSAQEEEEEKNYFNRYMKALFKLYKRGAATAGYVDRSYSTLLVALLELAALDEKKLAEAGKDPWLRKRIFDTDLLTPWLGPGERSAIFGLHSRSSQKYQNHSSP